MDCGRVAYGRFRRNRSRKLASRLSNHIMALSGKYVSNPEVPGGLMPDAPNLPEVNDLSLLSLLAAHEIERLRRKEPSTCHYVSILRNRLTHQMPLPTAEGVRNLAPSAVRVYRTAVTAATNVDPQNFEKLSELLSPLFAQLERASKAGSESSEMTDTELGTLLAFLTSLHSQLVGQKQRISAARAHSRYRS